MAANITTCNASNSVLDASKNSSNTGRSPARSLKSKMRRRGVVLYYTTAAMLLMSGFCSFAVDLGRVQLSKVELRRGADSAARAAAAELPDLNSAVKIAAQYVKSNTVDGEELKFNSGQDIEFGRWDTKTATFTKLTGSEAVAKANCVHITLRKTAERGNAVPLLFAKLLGKNSCNATGESYAMLVPGLNVDQNVPGTANPFLSGMPAGSIASINNPHKSPDFAGSGSTPKQSPLAVKMPLFDDDVLTFDSIDGIVRHDPNLPYFDPDGEVADIGHNNNTTNFGSSYSSTYYNENGIADVKAPINTLVGIFLDDRQPNTWGTPKNLDFSSAASRDFTELKPELKQIFFIGDGKNSDGTRQQFHVPKGATRLYLATWDFYEWNNNAGYRNIKVKKPQSIITVK